jgi:hypothetical protein
VTFDRRPLGNPVEELKIWIKPDKIRDDFSWRNKCVLLRPTTLNLFKSLLSSGMVSVS